MMLLWNPTVMVACRAVTSRAGAAGAKATPAARTTSKAAAIRRRPPAMRRRSPEGEPPRRDGRRSGGDGGRLCSRARGSDFRRAPPAPTRQPALLRGRRPPPELRAGRQGARRHRRRRRPPHPHPGEASRRRAVRATAAQCAPQPPRPGLSQGGAAHPGRGPRRLRATALHAPAGAHRLGRGGGREVAVAEARLVQGRPSRHRHRARDQPSERRPGAARLRRLARLYRRDLRAPPADPARGHAAGRNPLRGGAAAGVQPGAAGRARQAPRPGRAAQLAAALRSRLGR